MVGNIAFIVIMGLKEAIWGWKKRVVVKRELKRIARVRKANEVKIMNMAVRFTKKRGKAAPVRAYDDKSQVLKYQRGLVDEIGWGLLSRVNA